ncbi:MAG: DUF5063 domain-containing protein [Porphyromonadaceae bacterium]|nr:DUF5063 domain-containing protein [Porphyromonadaceae bacterium]
MEEKEQSLFTSEVIDFARVGVDFATLMEQNHNASYPDFIDKMTKILPLLYIQTKLLPEYSYDSETDYAPVYVTEESYDNIRSSTEVLLGQNDTFLTTQHEDMQYSDTPIGCSIAECLADIYQQVGDLLGTIREQDEMLLPSAIGRCLFYFHQYWGQRLTAALGALHSLCCLQVFGDEEEDCQENHIHEHEHGCHDDNCSCHHDNEHKDDCGCEDHCHCNC